MEVWEGWFVDIMQFFFFFLSEMKILSDLELLSYKVFGVILWVEREIMDVQ